MTGRQFSAFSEKRVGAKESGSARRLLAIIRDLGPMQEATDVRDLFAGLAQSVLGAVGADACLVSVIDRDRDVLRDTAAAVVAPYRLNSLVEEFSLNEFPATRRVIETGQGIEVAIDDPHADPAERRYLHDLGFDRVLITRLTLDGEAIGTIEAYRKANRPFRIDDPRQIDVLAAFASNAYSKILLAAKLEEHYTKTIEALCSALEARDPYTHAHTGRIRDLAIAVADAMRVGPDVRASVRLGSLLHDVGKIGISDAILKKPGPLDDGEWAVMRRHPRIGFDMLAGIEFLEPALPVVLHHHERWDGRGYAGGLEAEDIPLGARIVSVCDAYDAMTTDRVYRAAMPTARACEELMACAGTQFDPHAAAVLAEVVDRSAAGEEVAGMFVRYAI